MLQFLANNCINTLTQSQAINMIVLYDVKGGGEHRSAIGVTDKLPFRDEKLTCPGSLTLNGSMS